MSFCIFEIPAYKWILTCSSPSVAEDSIGDVDIDALLDEDDDFDIAMEV